MSWDSPLTAVADLVASCGDVGDDTGLRVTELVVETPLEMTVVGQEDGSVVLAAAPPRQAAQTSIMPVLHRIRLRVEVA